jgi:hypothetical protein
MVNDQVYPGRFVHLLCSALFRSGFETPREVEMAGLADRLYQRSVEVSKTYIALFNITHVFTIIDPRRYAIESIGLAPSGRLVGKQHVY